MTDSIQQYKQVCSCGHDKATHHEGQHNCLGVYCECKSFHKEGTPAPVVTKAPLPPPPEYDEDAIWDDLFPPGPRGP